MSSQLLPSEAFSEDSITPSSSISQIFTSHNETVTEISSSSNLPTGLELSKVKGRDKIIYYPTLREKIAIFESWWDQTPFCQQRKMSKKRVMKWGPEQRTSNAWNTFKEGALFPRGEPKVCCIYCHDLLQHPGVNSIGTKSMNYHIDSSCTQKRGKAVSKRTIREAFQQGKVYNYLS